MLNVLLLILNLNFSVFNIRLLKSNISTRYLDFYSYITVGDFLPHWNYFCVFYANAHSDTCRGLEVMIWSILCSDNTVLLMASCRAQAVADCSIHSSHCNHMEKSQRGSILKKLCLFPGSLSPDQLSFDKDLYRATSHLAFILC